MNPEIAKQMYSYATWQLLHPIQTAEQLYKKIEKKVIQASKIFDGIEAIIENRASNKEKELKAQNIDEKIITRYRNGQMYIKLNRDERTRTFY